MKKGNGLAMGLGLAAAVAGAYFLYGSEKGPERRKALKSWMVKMKGDVMEEMEKMEKLTKDVYFAAIDKVREKYQDMKNVDEDELDEITDKLKSHWEDIKKEVEEEAKDETKTRVRKMKK